MKTNTGLTVISTEPTPIYPTKHGYEYFVFRPLTLNMEWVAKGNKSKRKGV